MVLREHHFGIYALFSNSAANRDFGSLLRAVVYLIMMNCLRTTPNYLGAFIVCESIAFEQKNPGWVLIVKGTFMFFILRIVYSLIELTSKIHYDLGGPAILILACMSVLMKAHLLAASTVKRAIIIGLLVITMQCLTIFPPLAAFGFGHGEISSDIKLYAYILGMNDSLSFLMMLLFLIFLTATSLVIKLVSDENKLKRSVIKQREAEKQLVAAQYDSLMLRNLMETQNIVHDLKSPLTTIQGLSGLTAMIAPNEKIKEYQDRISNMVDRMNEMILEILHENQMSLISVDELVLMASANIAANEKLGGIVSVRNDCRGGMIRANRMRLMRAIINLVENGAIAAIKTRGPKSGTVEVTVERKQDRICIAVTDNGCGIPPENLGKIWEPGFSMSQSTGLGLSFVKRVVESHQGSIVIDSVIGRYTCVSVSLKEARSV
jgi:signal transduction histidine kinase